MEVQVRISIGMANGRTVTVDVPDYDPDLFESEEKWRDECDEQIAETVRTNYISISYDLDA